MHKIHIKFKELVRARITCRKQLLHYLAYLSEKNYNQIQLLKDISMNMQFRIRDDMNLFVSAMDLDLMIHENNEKHGLNYYFLTDELRTFLEQSQR